MLVNKGAPKQKTVVLGTETACSATVRSTDVTSVRLLALLGRL